MLRAAITRVTLVAGFAGTLAFPLGAVMAAELAGRGGLTVAELRARTLAALKRVTAANSPALFALLQSEAGYAKVEAAVLDRVLRHRRIPEAIIPQLESEWQGD